MYLLFRHHSLLPSEYLKKTPGEKQVLRAFVLRAHAPKAYENMLWQRKAQEREEAEQACQT